MDSEQGRGWKSKLASIGRVLVKGKLGQLGEPD